MKAFSQDDVRCLDCGTVYAKPVRGEPEQRNAVCPECGAVGWLAVGIAPSPPLPPRPVAAG